MAEERNSDNPVRTSEKEGITPGFLGGSGGGDKPSGFSGKTAEKEKKAKDARSVFGDAEEGATGGDEGEKEEGGLYRGGSIERARSEEERAGGLYNRFGSKSKNGKTGKKSFLSLKKSGPAFAIFGLLLGVGGLMGGSQSLMPFAISELLTEKFNSIGISSTMSSDAWLDMQLNQGIRLGNLKKGVTENLFAFSDYQVQSFKKQGIIVVGVGDTDSNTTQITALVYKGKDGLYIPVVGSDFLNYDSLTMRAAVVDGLRSSGYNITLDQISSPISVSDAMNDNNFRVAYTTASKSWRGGSSGWFDNIMSDVTEIKLGITRNRWVRFATSTMKDATQGFKKVASSNAKRDNMGDSGVDAKEKVEVEGEETVQDVKTVQIVEEVDADGNPVKSTTADVSDDAMTNSIAESSGGVAKVKNVLTSKAIKAAGAIANYSCALLEGLVSIYSIVSAYQSLQFLNLTSGYLEAVSKVKAGDGDESPMNEYATNFTTPGSTTSVDGEGNEYTVKGKESRTAMQSGGMAWLFDSKSKVSQSDKSVQNVNFETIMSNSSGLFNNIDRTMMVYSSCGYVKAGVAALDLATTIISFIPVAGQVVKAAQITAKEAAKIAIKAAVSIALYAVIPIAVKNIANMMIKDAATEWFGEDLGNALVSGANKYLGGNAVSGGQGPGSAIKVAEYLRARDTVIANEASYQRLIKSPFDITSRYTFLGSLAYSMIPLAYSGGGVMSAVSQVSSMTSSAVVGMLPTANAIDEQSVLSATGKCDLLESTDATGDAFCNPYIITDMSTVNISATDVEDIVHRMKNGDSTVAAIEMNYGIDDGNFNSDGSVRDGSSLSKYLSFCGQRTSQYGIKDAAIYERITGEDNTVVNIIGYIPVLNNFKDIGTGIEASSNSAWINGSACVASDENAYWNNEYRYYQRYAENQRLLENMNPGYESPVTAFYREQEELNPIDNSFEGQLARFSGMSKEKVEDTLALIEYYQFLDEYEPSERYAFGTPAVEEGKTLLFDNENTLAIDGILLNVISFADVRNRSFAV